jgi:hypothetical protein
LKRLTAISFLCLLLFNVAGYRLWFYYAGAQATAQLESAVENDQYERTDLITLTVPLTLPYQTDWADWEKVRGEIELNGVRYQYVQRKVVGGQMVLQCLPNKQQEKIESARDRFFELANSFHDDGAQKKANAPQPTKLTKPSFTDFDDFSLGWAISRFTPERRKPGCTPAASCLLIALDMEEQPPDLAV